jgi:hypothetical protein
VQTTAAPAGSACFQDLLVLVVRVLVPANVEDHMPARFDEFGIGFDFPENWTVDRSADGDRERTVTVFSPDTAFWSLTVYPGHVPLSELVDEALAAMQAEYPALEFDPVEDEIEEQTLIGYDINFFYLDLCNSAMIRSFQRNKTTYLLLCQAEDREMARAEPVFRAMTASLLRLEPPAEL